MVGVCQAIVVSRTTNGQMPTGRGWKKRKKVQEAALVWSVRFASEIGLQERGSDARDAHFNLNPDCVDNDAIVPSRTQKFELDSESD